MRDPFLETFNQPGPDNSCEVRETSTVAPQALTLMNAEEIQDRALAFAHRLLRGKKEKPENLVIEEAFQWALGRAATQDEVDICLQRWQKAKATEASKKVRSQTFPIQIQRTIMAEKTGEPYTFTERMPAYESYQADLQRNQVGPKTRGLAHVCLILFNLNEFSYLD